VTLVCLGIPARVVDVDGQAGTRVVVEAAATRRVVDAALVDEPLSPGDWVVVHLGFVMERVPEEDATELMAALAADESTAPSRTGEA
jgi:hydrogenase expression/formation protein HypC